MKNDETNGPTSTVVSVANDKEEEILSNGGKSETNLENAVLISEKISATSVSGITPQENHSSVTEGKIIEINSEILDSSKPNDSVVSKNDENTEDDDAKLRNSMAELISPGPEPGGKEKKPLKPILYNLFSTFYGGVRYFASLKNEDNESEQDENPFETSKPRFHPIHKGRKTFRPRLEDSGKRPYTLFGDIEGKLGDAAADDSNDSFSEDIPNSIKEQIDFNVVVTLEKLDKSLDETLTKPAGWAKINRLVAQPQTKKRRRRTNKMLLDDHAGSKMQPSTGRRRIKFEDLTPEDQQKADFESLRGYNFAPGTRVIAKWMDKNCYPGNVLSIDSIGRYKVRFLDGEIRDIVSNWVISLSQIKVNDNLMVCAPGNDGELVFQPAIVTACPNIENNKEWHEGIYEVDNTVKQMKEKISWEKFVLEAAQAKDYVAERNNKIAQQPGSIAETKEQRSTRGKKRKFTDSSNDDEDVDDLTFYEEEEEVARPKPRRRWKRDRNLDDTDFSPSSNSNRGTPKVNFAKLPVQIMTSVANQQRNVWPQRPNIPQRQMLRPKGPPTLDVYQEQQKAAELQTPPQPTKPKFKETLLVIKPYQQQTRGEPINRLMFANMRFVLTSATRAKDATGSEAEENPPAIAFNKRQIRNLIEERGGQIVDDFSQINDVTNCYLIADTHYRTHKYLSALVRAVPCVSHLWIFECVKENRIVPHETFMLPAGKSIETNQIIPWHDKCLTLLNGIKMYVHTEKPANPTAIDFTQIWTPIARSMGAIIVDVLPELSEDPADRFDILLTDASCSEDVVARAKALNATPVSSEWLIQAMLTGVLPSTSGHPKYQHDFVELVDMP